MARSNISTREYLQITEACPFKGKKFGSEYNKQYEPAMDVILVISSIYAMQFLEKSLQILQKTNGRN